jgi:2,4-dienoyl-CoA reductase-like NADH-dependent reductase (Old Yellow Enzyme family)
VRPYQEIFNEHHPQTIIHAGPRWTLHTAEPASHGSDDPQPCEIRRHAGDLAAEYYAQRASIGLIVTEGTQPSDDGQGYLATPGIYTPAHIAGWQKVTRAVHENDGHIFIQMIGQRRSGLQPHPSHSAGFAIADRARRGVHAVSFGRAYSNTELAALGNFVLAHFGGKQGNLTQEDVAKHRTQ